MSFFQQISIKPFSTTSFIGRVLNSIFIYNINERSLESVRELEVDKRVIEKLNKLWDNAHRYMTADRLSLAEKSLNGILEIDSLNAAAYNRLGIIEAKRSHFDKSIKHFEMTISIEPAAAAFHNLGLVFYETKQYKKSASAFAKSIRLEPGLAARYVAYAKVNDEMGKDEITLQALLTAAKLEYSKETLSLLSQFYKSRGMNEEVNQVTLEIKNIRRRVKPDDEIDDKYEDLPLPVGHLLKI